MRRILEIQERINRQSTLKVSNVRSDEILKDRELTVTDIPCRISDINASKFLYGKV